MRKAEFIRLHREAIDRRISERLDFVPRTASCYCPRSGTAHTHAPTRRLNNSDRAEWLANDEALYLWAREEGVRV